MVNSSSGVLKLKKRKSEGKNQYQVNWKMEQRVRCTGSASLIGLCSHFGKIMKREEKLTCTPLLLMIS